MRLESGIAVFIVLTGVLAGLFAIDGFAPLPRKEQALQASGVVLSWHYQGTRGRAVDFRVSGSTREFRLQRFVLSTLSASAKEILPIGSHVEILSSSGGTGLSDVETVYELRSSGKQVFSFDQYLTLEGKRRQGIHLMFGIALAAMCGLLVVVLAKSKVGRQLLQGSVLGDHNRSSGA